MHELFFAIAHVLCIALEVTWRLFGCLNVQGLLMFFYRSLPLFDGLEMHVVCLKGPFAHAGILLGVLCLCLCGLDFKFTFVSHFAILD